MKDEWKEEKRNINEKDRLKNKRGRNNKKAEGAT